MEIFSFSIVSGRNVLGIARFHVLQWGEEVFNVALLEFPNQNHTYLIQFILHSL